MNKYGTLINPTTLQFVRLLPGTTEQVWEFIIDSEKRGLWFAGGPADIRPGGKMKLVFNNSQFAPPDPTPEKYKEFGDGFISEATIRKCEPPTLLEIAWDGIVRFELEQMGDQVQLTLTHEMEKDDREMKTGALAGWHTHLGILTDRLQGQSPQPFWPVHMGLEEEYSDRLD
ncbi:MAG: SRPBCC family protein [Bacteroidota bacterium]